MKLAFITDPSPSYVHFQRDLLVESWGGKELQKVSRLSEVGNTTLFGDPPISAIELLSASDVKQFLKDWDNLSESDLEDKFASGLIITSSLNKNSTRKLAKTVSEIGEVYSSSAKNLTELLVKNHLNLNREAEDFLIDYLGDDYSSVIPLVKSLRKLSKSAQRKITIENLWYRLPRPPGGVPPWEIEKPLWRGDTVEMIEVYRRIASNSSDLLPVVLLAKKMKLVFRISVLLEENPRITTSEVSVVLGVPDNYPLKISLDIAKRLGWRKAEKAVLLLDGLEHKLKGGGSGVDQVEVETTLIKLARMFR